MIKKIIIFVSIALLMFAGAYFGMDTIAQSQETPPSVSYLSIYIYFFVATVLIYLLILGGMNMVPDKVGFLFLALVFIKLGVFVMIFKSTVFGEVGLPQTDKIALFLALLISLVLEGVFIAKLLKQKP